MKAPITILSLLCVLALGIAGLLMLGSDDPAERSARAVETGTSAVTQAGDPAAAGPRAPSEGEPAAGGGHREAQDAVAIPGAATVHLRGRVESDGPCGGGDPELTVYALHEPSTVAVLVAALGGEDDERARDLVSASAPVSPDGTFELSAPEGEEGLHLMALGLVLYGEASVAVDSARASESVTLPVRCGAAVVGSIAPPEGSTEVDLTQAELEVVPAAAVDSRDRFQRGHRRAIHARADGRFTLPAISVRGPLRLVVDHADFAPQRIDLGALEPGAVREVGLRLTAGATLAGHVVDGAGAGVQGAEVHAVVDVQIGAEGYGARETESGPDGAFSLEGVAPGDLTVQAEKRGYLEGRRFLTVAEGQAVADLVLELDEGNSVAGLVHWSDGTPAAGAHVRARFDRSQLFSGGGLNAASGAGGKAECDEEGRFTITGLGMGPFELRASSERDAGGSAAGDGEAQDGSWSARLEHVRPGSEDLLLVLEAPLGIAGRVVDEDERPVTAFEVRAVKTFETPVGPVEQTREERSFEGEDGTFLLSGLERGDWVLHAVADGLAGTEGVSVALAEEGAEGIVIPLVHAGTVSGTVYTPEGVPAADATVFVGAEGPGWKHQVSGAPDLPSATTDGDGAFTLEGVLPGQVEVQGRAEGFATSVSALVDLRPREHVEGVELFLTAGGTLTGEVIGDDERPAASATIQLVHMGEFEIRFTTTDSEGLFRLENLDPGDYQVNAMPRASRMIEMADGESDSLGKLVAELKTAMVEISEGEETHVVLGTPAQDPVEVSGRVTLDGEPYSPAFVTFFREGGDDLSKTRPATTDDEGRYTITVDGAGSYLALVQQMSGALGGQSSVEFTVEVPEGSSFTRDLELPLGRISGLVRGSDGSPAPEERVTLLPGGAAHTGMFWGGRFHGEVRTDEEGRFDLRGLAPGEYVLAVGGMAGGGLFGGEPAHGRLVRGVHVGEGEWIRDLELRLELPGAIEATVTDTSGNLVEGATLFVRNAEGRPVDLISTLTTDAHGRCSYRGLEPGVYTASARQTSGFASQESEPVRVEAGHAAQLSLTVEEGTLLVVQLVDGERRPVRGAVSVVDAEGREVGNLFGLSDILGLMKEGGAGMTANVHRAGPLAPGRYRVTGTGPDGRQVSKPLNLTNRPRRTLTLRFKD